MTRDDLLGFLRLPRLWVEATISPTGSPQAAVIGAVVSDDFELFFDTLASSRKLQNLRRDQRIALVGWEGERTAQIEGLTDEPSGEELARLKRLYFERFPDGRTRELWPGIAYARVRPTWIRLSDFGVGPPAISTFSGDLFGR